MNSKFQKSKLADGTLAIYMIVVLLWMGPAVKIIQKQNLHNTDSLLIRNFNPTKINGIHYLCQRRIGKKQTTNSLARYRYGNRKDKGIRNIHVNIRSLKYKVQEVKCIIEEKSPHLIGLSETELKKDSTDIRNLKIPGYDILFLKSWDIEGFARVIVYVKKTFKYEQVRSLEDDNIQSIWNKGQET